ncbi:MAG: hypothetical protein ACRC14_03980 [Paracoccaceae bacterium]
MLLTLPWPPASLSGHANGHWRAKHTLTKAAKLAAFWTGKEARLPCWPNAALTFTFHPPARGGLPDVQNMPGRCKAMIDGLAQAMGCDDRKFRPRFPDHLGPRRGEGAVVVLIEE